MSSLFLFLLLLNRHHLLDINFSRLAICLFSGSELELIETQSKGVNKQLVFKAKTPGRQYHSPESKLSSTDMTR